MRKPEEKENKTARAPAHCWGPVILSAPPGSWWRTKPVREPYAVVFASGIDTDASRSVRKPSWSWLSLWRPIP